MGKDFEGGVQSSDNEMKKVQLPEPPNPRTVLGTVSDERYNALKKSIEDKKKALSKNKIIFKDGNTKI